MPIKIVENKIAASAAFKCGSRTAIAYAYLIRYPNAINENPDWFSPNGIYHYTIPFGTSIWITTPIAKALKYRRIVCIVRDPICRFISAYSDKIRQYKGSEKTDVQEFIDLYDLIESRTKMPEDNEDKISVYEHIKSHTQPLYFTYGTDASIYTDILNLTQMKEFKDLIENDANLILPNLKLNETIPEIKITLNASQQEWISRRYKKDIELYGKWM